MPHIKRLLTCLLAALGIGASAQSIKPSPSAVISELRAKALSVKPVDLGLSPTEYADKPWGVLMETGFEGGTSYSLVVLADGSISLYFSTGGGVIGAGGHPSVHRAGDAMLTVAARLQVLASPTASTALPKTGQVNFYLLTSKGTLLYAAPEQELGDGHDKFSELFYAGQNVITGVRETETSKSAAPRN